MKSVPASFLATVALLTSLAACERESRSASTHTVPDNIRNLATSLSKLNVENPIFDLERNLAKRNTRFMGVYGYSCAPPGTLSAAELKVAYSRGLNCIDGTTDYVAAGPYESLYGAAWRYAEIYNEELMQRIERGAVP